MANYANQKRITINGDILNKVAHQRDGPFLRAIDWKYIEVAQQVLSGNELDLLIYLLKWAGQGYCDFSPKDVEMRTQLSKSTIHRSFQTLCDLGYIKQTGPNSYSMDLFPEGIQERADALLARKVIK